MKYYAWKAILVAIRVYANSVLLLFGFWVVCSSATTRNSIRFAKHCLVLILKAFSNVKSENIQYLKLPKNTSICSPLIHQLTQQYPLYMIIYLDCTTLP